MANRTFLITTPGEDKPVEEVETTTILCAASYMIPVYWYMLFDAASVKYGAVTTEDGWRRMYPYLSGRTDQVVARARGRLDHVVQTIGASQTTLFETWANYIASTSQAHVHVETLELWAMFDDTPSLEKHLATCLAAFDSTRPVEQSPEWQELLGQANAWDGKAVSPAGAFSLCGYSWDAKVPWE